MPARTRARAVACVLVSIFVVAGCGFRLGGPGYGDTVSGIECDRGGNVSFRATVHLWLIKRDGGREGPTGRVGSSGSACNYWVQTPLWDGGPTGAPKIQTVISRGGGGTIPRPRRNWKDQ
ncbi:MAG: hypothetical protein ABSE70_10060 [Candidatus Limnocylindrales bacterium]